MDTVQQNAFSFNYSAQRSPTVEIVGKDISATLMTSDRGYTGEAEMQRSPNPVTSKAPGLNPNANVFQSKSPTTAMHPEGPQEGDQSAKGDHSAKCDLSPASSTASHGFAYMNGVDGGETDEGIQDDAVIGSTSDVPDDGPDFANMNGGSETTAAASSSETASVTDVADEGTLEDKLPDDQLRAMLKNQLEYYFSRENLANDSYLASQMDGDQFVPISTIAGFNQVKRLTNSLELVVNVLRESGNVQVDEKGLKVRPMHKRCVVILREIPHTTPLEDVAGIFSGTSCPKFATCEFAHNNSWYVTFDSEEDAQLAYQYLREEVKTFLGKPILARIKAKPLLRNSFVPKNGFKAVPLSPQPQQFLPSLYNQTPTSAAPTAPPPQPPASPQSAPAAPQPTPPAPQQQVPSQTMSQKFTYPSQVPSVHYIPQQQQFPFFPPAPASLQMWANIGFPFFPPAPASLQMWANPAVTYFDPGTAPWDALSCFQAFAANGYTPTAFNLASATRHSFQNARNRNTKPHKSAGNQGDRMAGNVYRNGGARAHSGGSHMMPNVVRRDNHVLAAHNHLSNTRIEPQNSRGQTDNLSKDQVQRRVNYRSRRRNKGVDDDELKRQHSSQAPTKEAHPMQPPGSSNGDSGGSVSGTGGVGGGGAHHQPAKFELEATSFPPLPGFTDNMTAGEVFENKMSDVVKGTAKPSSSASKDMKVSTPTMAASMPSGAAPATATPSHPPLSSTHIVPPPKAKGPTTVTTEKKPAVTGAVAMTTVTPTVANDTVASLPAQPSHSRQKVTRSTSTDSMTNDTQAKSSTAAVSASASPLSPTTAVTSSSSSATVSTQTTTKASTKPDETKPNMTRLSYAQMALRGKDRVAAAVPAEKTEPTKENAVTSSVSSTPESCTRSSNTLREQQSGGMHSPTRTDYHRKDDQRVVGRRAKENREWERRDRARVPFRERRRENRDFDAQPRK
ncbi:hypothetical protein LSAT2_007213 [Lamellibrachia satsuma]|nr:hypothetical protein LSAT2_007213 [Lamellibrachia satsuma]